MLGLEPMEPRSNIVDPIHVCRLGAHYFGSQPHSDNKKAGMSTSFGLVEERFLAVQRVQTCGKQGEHQGKQQGSTGQSNRPF